MAITDTGTTGQGTDGPASSEPATGDEQEQLVAGGGLPPSGESPSGESPSREPEPIGPSRRRVIAIASALAIVVIVFLVIAAIIGTTQTEFGRERLRRFLVSRIADRMKGRGTMYIGRIGGSLLTGVTLDS